MNNLELVISDDLPNEFCEIYKSFHNDFGSGRSSFMATGGSQATLCYPILAPQLPGLGARDHPIDVYLGDERLVPVRNQASNTALIESLLFATTRDEPWQQVGFFSPAFGHAKTLETLTHENFEEDQTADEQALAGLAKIVSSYDKVLEKASTPRFVHLGLGPDGHIASLFPNLSDLGFHFSNCQISKDLTGLNPHIRISMTLDFINRSDLVVLSVTTKEKGAVLAKVFKNPDEFPAGRLDPKRLIVLIDRSASQGMNETRA